MAASELGGVPPEHLLAARRSALFLLTLTDYGAIDRDLLARLDVLLNDINTEITRRAERDYPGPSQILGCAAAAIASAQVHPRLSKARAN